MLRLLAACAAASSVFAQSGVFDVRAYGAVGDGVTDDTGAVRKAAAALEGAGGGTLLFDAGYKFLTGAFNISSNTYMVVAGTILGQTDNTKYELIQPLPWYGGGQDAQESGQLEWGSLIRSYPGSTNVTITGGGVIDGQGEPWYSCINKPAAPCSGYSRPHLLLLYSTVGVVIHNITLQSSPAWTLHLANCTDVHVYNTTILSTGPNTDGVDIDCSQNVLVSPASVRLAFTQLGLTLALALCLSLCLCLCLISHANLAVWSCILPAGRGLLHQHWRRRIRYQERH